MGMEWFLALLPWLALLACPVVMFWMMRGMHGGSCDKAQASGAAGARHASAVDGHPVAIKSEDISSEMAQLRERLARLEARRAQVEGVEVHP